MISSTHRDVPVGQFAPAGTSSNPRRYPTPATTTPARKYPAPPDDDLVVGITQIAERLRYPANTVSVWKMKDQSFPKPRYRVSRDLGWWWPEVEAWATEHGKLRET